MVHAMGRPLVPINKRERWTAMLKWVRSQVNYTNAGVTIAIIFAMAGGAYAETGRQDGRSPGSTSGASAQISKSKSAKKSSKFLITKVQQIAPGVRSQLRGAAGPKGATGATGPQGLQGSAGSKGNPGSTGVDGESVSVKEVKVGESACNHLGGSEFKVGGGAAVFACNGKEGEEGTEGSPWTDTGALPAGKTETGVVGGISGAGKGLVAPLSFPIPLAGQFNPMVGSNVYVVNFKEASPPSQCPGTPMDPTAAEGYLCIYMGEFSAAIKSAAGVPITSTEGTTSGAVIELFTASEGEPVVGSFAVTGK